MSFILSLAVQEVRRKRVRKRNRGMCKISQECHSSGFRGKDDASDRCNKNDARWSIIICVTWTSPISRIAQLLHCSYCCSFQILSSVLLLWYNNNSSNNNFVAYECEASWNRDSSTMRDPFLHISSCYADIRFRESRTQTSLFSQNYLLINSQLRTFDTLDPRIVQLGGFSTENPPTDTLYHKSLISRRHKSPFPQALVRAYGGLALIIRILLLHGAILDPLD